MPKSKQKQLEEYRLLIYGVSDNEEIKNRISAIYSEERISQGIALYQETKAAFEAQDLEKIEANQANHEYKNTYEEINAMLVKIRKAGRYFFQNNIELNTLLRLNKEIPATYADWKALAEATVSAVMNHTEIQNKLALVDLTPEAMNKLKELLGLIDTQKLKAEKENGEAQLATEKRNESFASLQTYCSDLRACLSLFFDGSGSQILEQVGILVR